MDLLAVWNEIGFQNLTQAHEAKTITWQSNHLRYTECIVRHVSIEVIDHAQRAWL